MGEQLPRLLPIDANTAKNLQWVTTLSFGKSPRVAWSPDEKRIVVSSTRGLWLHESVLDTPRQLQTTRRAVKAIDISPDGKRLASAEEDRVIWVRDLSSGKELFALTVHDAIPLSVKFSPKHNLLFAGYSDANLRVWDLSRGTLFKSLPCIVKLPTTYNHVAQLNESIRLTQLLFSDDGNTLAVCGKSYTNIFLVDVNTYGIKHNFEVVDYEVIGLAFTDSDELLLVSLYAKNLGVFQIWNAQSGELEDEISTYFYNPEPKSKNNRWVAENLEDGNAQTIVNTQTGRQLPSRLMKTHSGAFNRFETRGLHLSYRGELELWDIPERKLLGRSNAWYRENYNTEQLAFSSDSTKLAVGGTDSGVRVWDLHSGTIISTILLSSELGWGFEKYKIAFDTNDELLLFGCTSTGIFKVVNAKTQEIIQELPSGPAPNGPGGRAFAVSSDRGKLASASEHSLILWDMLREEQNTIWRSDTEVVKFIAFSPGGKFLVFHTREPFSLNFWSTIHIVNIDEQTELLTLAEPFHSVGFVPSEDALFVMKRVEREDVLEIWDLGTNASLGELPGSSTYIGFAEFDQSGELAIVGTWKSIDFWQWKTRVLLNRVTLTDDDIFLGMALSPDKKTLVTLSHPSGELRTWGVPEQITEP